jgi:ribosomal protein S17E
MCGRIGGYADKVLKTARNKIKGDEAAEGYKRTFWRQFSGNRDVVPRIAQPQIGLENPG